MTIWTNSFDYAWNSAVHPDSWPELTPADSELSAAAIVPGGGAEIGSNDYTVYPLEAGSIGLLFGNDFYHRLHVLPRAIDFGNLVGIQQQVLHIWNAWLFDRRVEGIALANGDSLSVGGDVAPFNIAPLESVVYTVNADSDGPAVVDAVLSIDLDRGELLAVQITGRRVIAWTWRAGWGNPVVERLEWRTDVIESYDGDEQRRALRLYPRRTIEFDILGQGGDRRRLESALWAWGSRTWCVPLWMDGTTLATPAQAGDTLIHCATTYREFQPGAFVMLCGDAADAVDIGEVVGATDSTVALLRPLIRSWPIGTRVYPARAGRLQVPPALDRFTGDALSCRVVVDLFDPQQWSAEVGATYRGLPVIELTPNWIRQPLASCERRTARFDGGVGLQYFDEEAAGASAEQTMMYSLPGRAMIDVWRRILHALKGRCSSVWVRTHASDMKIVATTVAASPVFVIESMGMARFLQAAVGRRDIRIEMADGTVLYRRITAFAELDAQSEQITVDAAPGIDVTPDGVRSVSFLTLARLNADAVELAWWTGDMVESSVTFKGVLNDV